MRCRSVRLAPKDVQALVMERAGELGIAPAAIDWRRVAAVAAEHAGIARPVTR